MYVLSEADLLVILADGQIQFQGTYESFLAFSQNNESVLRNLNYDIADEPGTQETVSKSKDYLSVISEERDTGDIPVKIYLNFFLESFRTILNLVLYGLFCIGIQGLFVIIQILSLIHI